MEGNVREGNEGIPFRCELFVNWLWCFELFGKPFPQYYFSCVQLQSKLKRKILLAEFEDSIPPVNHNDGI
jgi:hypothetical protein